MNVSRQFFLRAVVMLISCHGLCSATSKPELINSVVSTMGGTLVTFDILSGEGNTLTACAQRPLKSLTPFVTDLDFHGNLQKSLGESSDRHVVFVDFDGVLASHQLIAPSGRVFKHLMNTSNTILEAEINVVKNLLASEAYGAKRKAMQERLLALGLELAPVHVQPHVFFEILKYFKNGIHEGHGNFGGFTSRYEPVDQELYAMLAQQKEQGAALFVLSARQFSEDKRDFLAKHYPEIFTLTDFKMAMFSKVFAEVSTYKGDTPSLAADAAYIFSLDKFRIVGHTPLGFGDEEKLYVSLIDDHAARVKQFYAPKILDIANMKAYRADYFLVPYPNLIKHFDPAAFIEELADLFELIDAELAGKFLPAKQSA